MKNKNRKEENERNNKIKSGKKSNKTSVVTERRIKRKTNEEINKVK